MIKRYKSKRSRRHSGNTKGFTMVELIVTFALLGMLMVAASYIVTSGLSVYYQVKNTNYAQTVSDTILDKIAGEISGAQVGAEARYTVTISTDKKELSLYNRYGSPIVLRTGADGTEYEKKLVLHYLPINQGTTAEKAATDWTFDTDMYMNYDIENLTFEQYMDDSGKGTNVVVVTLDLKNWKNGFEYTQTRYVKCYNFKDASDVDKITYGAMPTE